MKVRQSQSRISQKKIFRLPLPLLAPFADTWPPQTMAAGEGGKNIRAALVGSSPCRHLVSGERGGKIISVHLLAPFADTSPRGRKVKIFGLLLLAPRADTLALGRGVPVAKYSAFPCWLPLPTLGLWGEGWENNQIISVPFLAPFADTTSGERGKIFSLPLLAPFGSPKVGWSGMMSGRG